MADSKTIEPWFDFDAMEWLREPQKLLTEEDSARLIAAAPELLKALNKLVRQDYNVVTGRGFEASALDQAIAAIAKAEGR